MQPALACDDGTVAEVCRHCFRRESGGHDDDAQLGPNRRLQEPHHAEREVIVKGALVKLVEEDGADLHIRVRTMAEAERGIAAALAKTGAQVVSIGPEAADLEDVFLELTR